MANQDLVGASNSQGKQHVKKVMWILDSGCSNHMTGDKSMLSQFEEKFGP